MSVSLGFVVARAAALALLASALGCGSGVASLSPVEFDRLPHESRQEIFDAENDLVIAHNRQDDAEDHKRDSQTALTRLESRWDHLSRRLNSSGQRPKVGAARRVFDAQAAYLRAEVEVANAEIDEGRVETKLNRARLVLVRQRQLARLGRVTAGSLKPLEERVTVLEGSYKNVSVEEGAVRTRAEKQLEAWKAAEDDYTRSSAGDFDTVVWSE